MNRFRLSPQKMHIISYIFYASFASLFIYNMIKADKILDKILYGILLIIILGISLWSEHLKHLYQRALKILLYDLDPERAKTQFDILLKKDPTKAYQKDRILFDMLYCVDQAMYQEALDELETNTKFFHASLDQLLIYHFNRFYCSFMLDELETAKSEYQKIARMKNSKTKGMKVSPLYNWEFLEAMYQMARKDYKTSYNLFERVNIDTMNPRERIQYYYQFASLCTKRKNYEKADELHQKIKNEHGKSVISQ